MFYKYNTVSGRLQQSSQIASLNPAALQSKPIQATKLVPESKKAAALFNEGAGAEAVRHAATKIPKNTLVLCGIASAVGYAFVMMKVWT